MRERNPSNPLVLPETSLCFPLHLPTSPHKTAQHNPNINPSKCAPWETAEPLTKPHLPKMSLINTTPRLMVNVGSVAWIFLDLSEFLITTLSCWNTKTCVRPCLATNVSLNATCPQTQTIHHLLASCLLTTFLSKSTNLPLCWNKVLINSHVLNALSDLVFTLLFKHL